MCSGSKSSSGKASAFNLKFDEKEAVAKLSTAAKNPEIMKLVGDRLPMSDNRPAKETPKINTPEEGETMYSNVFPGLISDEEEVLPFIRQWQSCPALASFYSVHFNLRATTCLLFVGQPSSKLHYTHGFMSRFKTARLACNIRKLQGWLQSQVWLSGATSRITTKSFRAKLLILMMAIRSTRILTFLTSSIYLGHTIVFCLLAAN